MLTIDLSLRNTGVAYFENGELIKYFSYKTDKKMTSEEKAVFQIQRIDNIINILRPDIVVVEDTFAKLNMQTLKWLTRVQGAVYLLSLKIGADFELIYPASWRKYLSFKQGNGIKQKELKEASIRYIKDNLNIDITDDNICDAINIGLAYIKKCEGEEICTIPSN